MTQVTPQLLHNRELSPKAAALIDFDIGSIRQVIASAHATLPTIWLADPDQYELNGRVLRDSTSARLLAYSPGDHVIYATDGCNSCAHHLSCGIESLPPESLALFAGGSDIHPDMLELLRELSIEHAEPEGPAG